MPSLAAILGAPKKGAPAVEEEDSFEEETPGEEEAAAFAELAEALKSGDATTGVMALKNLMKECGY